MMQVLQAMNSSRLNETGAFRFTLMLNSLLSFHNDLLFFFFFLNTQLCHKNHRVFLLHD